MNKTRIGFLVAALLCAFSASTYAQKKGDAKKAQAAEKPATEAAAVEGVNAEAAAGANAEAAAEVPGVGGEELPGEVPGGEGLEDICKLDPAACPQLDMEKEAARPMREQIYAVQQVFALRARRF